jgi:hypothetical protein
MSWEFKPGVRVVCVFDDWPPGFKEQEQLRHGSAFPVKGRVYTLRDVVISEDTRELLVRLVEIVNPPVVILWDGSIGEPLWGAFRFRPLDESRLDVFRNLLVDLQKEEELA